MTLVVLTLVLIVPSLLFAAAATAVPGLDVSVWTGARVGITLLFLLTGSAHFVRTESMARMLPPRLPFRVPLVHLTGALELLGAVGIWIPSVSPTVGLSLIVMVALFLPVKVYAALKRVQFGGHGGGPAYLWARIPFQLLLMGWIYGRPRGGTCNTHPVVGAWVEVLDALAATPGHQPKTIMTTRGDGW